MTTYRPSLRTWVLAVLLGLANPVQALVITAVTAPNLTRPLDGVFYPFDITVSGVFDRSDLVLGVPNVQVEYWDEDFFIGFDDAIDLGGVLGAVGPATAVGAAWGPVGVAGLSVGCTNGGVVDGPAAGTTGESPMNDGYFAFYTGAGIARVNLGEWGFNTVTCLTGATGVNPIPPFPALRSVPEPGTLALLGVALAGFGIARRRKLR